MSPVGLPQLIGCGVLAVIAWTLFSAHLQPPPTIEGKQPIHYAPSTIEFIRKAKDGSGRLDIVDEKRTVLRSYVVDRGGVLNEDPNQAASGGLRLVFTPNLPVIDIGTVGAIDVGAFVAVPQHGHAPLSIGLRLSPGRVGFDAVSPDLVITENAIGLGISVYPPARAVGYPWSHFGLGLWYLHSYRDDGPDGLAVGLTSSLRL